MGPSKKTWPAGEGDVPVPVGLLTGCPPLVRVLLRASGFPSKRWLTLKKLPDIQIVIIRGAMRKQVRSINMTIENIGRLIKSSKKKYTWEFKVDHRDYCIIYTRSTMSGKDKIILNGQIIYQHQSLMRNPLHFVFKADDNEFLLTEYEQTFKLFINSKDFDDYFGHDRVKSILKKSRFEDEQEQSKLRLSALYGQQNPPPSVQSQNQPSSRITRAITAPGSERSIRTKKRVHFNLENNQIIEGSPQQPNNNLNESYIRGKTGLQGNIPFIQPEIVASPLADTKNQKFIFSPIQMQVSAQPQKPPQVEQYNPYESSLLNSSIGPTVNAFNTNQFQQPVPQNNHTFVSNTRNSLLNQSYDSSLQQAQQRNSLGQNNTPNHRGSFQGNNLTAFLHKQVNEEQSLTLKSEKQEPNTESSGYSFYPQGANQKQQAQSQNQLPRQQSSLPQSQQRQNNIFQNQQPQQAQIYSGQQNQYQFSSARTIPTTQLSNFTSTPTKQEPNQFFSPRQQPAGLYHIQQHTKDSPQNIYQGQASANIYGGAAQNTPPNSQLNQSYTHAPSPLQQSLRPVQFDATQMQAIGLPHPSTYAKQVEPLQINYPSGMTVNLYGQGQTNKSQGSAPPSPLAGNYRGSLPLNLYDKKTTDSNSGQPSNYRHSDLGSTSHPNPYLQQQPQQQTYTSFVANQSQSKQRPSWQ